MRAKGTAVDNIVPQDLPTLQRQKLALLADSDAAFGSQTSNPQAIEAAIANYETAFRMQSSVPDLADISREPGHLQKLYGVDSPDEHQRFYALSLPTFSLKNPPFLFNPSQRRGVHRGSGWQRREGFF